MISKECFVKTIEVVKREREKYNDLNNFLKEHNYVDSQIYDYSVENIVLDIFEDIFEDLFKNEHWISYYFYELDFGERNKYISIEIEYGIEKEYDVSTPEKFYDFLIENMGK